MDNGQKAILKAHPELCSGELKTKLHFGYDENSQKDIPYVIL
jgi:hypothetical protein